MIQAVRGWVSQSPSCLIGRQTRNGPIASRAIGRGRPVNSGKNGLPSKSNGGAAIVNRRGLTICTCKRRVAQLSSGEEIEMNKVNNPPRKLGRRQQSNSLGARLRNLN